MTDHQWSELAAPYALGALTPDERTGFEAHLAECATCRAEVQTLRDVTGLLVHAAQDATPSPALRERVMREARKASSIGPRSARAPVLPWLAAAACLGLALGAAYGYLHERSARTVALRALAAAEDTITARDSLVATLLSPDVGSAALAATGKPPSARLYWSPSRHRVVMAVYDLAPAPAGRIYQLWAIARGKPVSLGIFNTSANGRLTAALNVPAGLTFEVTAVTEEPAGGSPQPTQQPFLIGKVARGD
ncbi:MAG TPA: anti-sigma factor [Gemmatimonadales bacterium]|nr:anti-sigma factor [Gemmatimonadales bacterium]